MIEPPCRQDTTPRCRCILRPPDALSDAMGFARDRENRCREDTTPDAPFCPECEDRHADYVARGFTVTAAPLVDR